MIHVPEITQTNIAGAALLVLVLVIAVYTDLRWGKIYNKLTFPAIIIGVILGAITGGLHGLAQSLGGAALVLVIFLLFAPLTGFGGGDIKLMMAVGAIVGFSSAIWAILVSAIAGGVLSLGAMLLQGSLGSTLRRMGINLFLGTIQRAPVNITDGGSKLKIKYSPAIALGTILALLWRG